MTTTPDRPDRSDCAKASSDKLAEIKRNHEADMYGWVRIDSADFDWLISEVERLRGLLDYFGELHADEQKRNMAKIEQLECDLKQTLSNKEIRP